MKKFIYWMQKAENFILASTFIVMTLSAFAQVVNRNLIGAGVSWFEELARYCMVYMALLGTEVGLRDGTQIAITAVLDKFKGAPKDILLILGKLVVVVFSAVVFVTSFELLDKQMRFGQTTPGLGIPMYVPYFALTLSFGLITLVQGAALLAMIAGFFGRKNRNSAKGGAA